MRDALVAALVACANSRPLRSRTRRFLTGLSSDELQFIAEYLGCRIPGCAGGYRRPQNGAPQSRDLEHKLILLVEFLSRSGMQQQTLVRAQAAQWN